MVGKRVRSDYCIQDIPMSDVGGGCRSKKKDMWLLASGSSLLLSMQ
jgi:hypothetical protein